MIQLNVFEKACIERAHQIEKETTRLREEEESLMRPIAMRMRADRSNPENLRGWCAADRDGSKEHAFALLQV